MARVASPRVRGLLVVAVLMPLWASYLVKVYSWRLILAEDGVLNWFLAPFGLKGPGYGEVGAVARRSAYLWLPYMILPLLRRPRADPDVAPRGLVGSRRRGLDDVPAGHPAARRPGPRRRLDLHVLADARRLHRAVACHDDAVHRQRDLLANFGVPATCRSRRRSRSCRSRSCSSTCCSPGGSARSRRSDGGRARLTDRAPAGDGRGAALHLRPARARRRSTRSTRAGRRPGRRAGSRSTGSQTAIANTGLRDAFVTSLAAALGATLVALILGTLASLAVARYRFFGRETISFVIILPIALPGIVTGMALSTTFAHARRYRSGCSRSSSATRRSASSSSTTTSSPGCGGTAPSLEEASADLGADTLADVPPHHAPGDADRAARRRAARVRAVVRRGDRDDLHARAACRRSRSGSSRASGWRTRSPLVNVAGLVAILLSVIPVYIATRITSDTGAAGRT